MKRRTLLYWTGLVYSLLVLNHLTLGGYLGLKLDMLIGSILFHPITLIIGVCCIAFFFSDVEKGLVFTKRKI